MTDSDHEEGDMDKLELSSDSTDIMTKKRSREEDSEDETKNLSTKKQRNSFGEQSGIVKKENINSDKNNINEYNIKEEKHTIYSKSEQNVQEKFLPESNMKEDKEKQDNKLIKEENGNDSPFDKDDSTDEIIHDFVNKTIENTKIKVIEIILCNLCHFILYIYNFLHIAFYL